MYVIALTCLLPPTFKSNMFVKISVRFYIEEHNKMGQKLKTNETDYAFLRIGFALNVFSRLWFVLLY